MPDASGPPHGRPVPGRRDLLLPVLPSGTGPPDPVAIATWHLAVSDAVGAELPHDLLALWLFPESGGVVLLGPAALAADQVVVSRPETFLGQDQLLALEDRVRSAGYASVIAAPVRDQRRDLGLMLLAALAAGRYGPLQAIRLFEILRQFGPAFSRLGERMTAAGDEAQLPTTGDPERLLDVVARTVAEARSPGDLLARLSAALHTLLPHDELELLVPGRRSGTWERFGRDPARSPAGAAAAGGLDAITERMATARVLAVPDLAAERGLAWPVRGERRDSQRLHAMLATLLRQGGETVGYLVLGSVARDLYRPVDEDRLAALADIIAGRVTGLRALEEVDALRRTVAALEGPGGSMARMVRLLATTPQPTVSARAAAAILREVTGSAECWFVLRMGATEAVILEPGDPRPLLDLPLVPIADAAFAPVLRGEVPLILRTLGDLEELLLPFRLAGRPFGVVVLAAPAGGRLAAVTHAAQQLADALAPHLELLRREAGLPALESGRQD